MTEVEAWVIDTLERLERDRQESQHEQLRLPLYEEPPREQERDRPKPAGPIVIQL